MNRPRLLHLISILESIPEKAYNQSHWHCGTTACAGGHAAMDILFNVQGLRLSLTQQTPIFNAELGLTALEQFFELTPKQSDYIFGSQSYHSLSRALADENGDEEGDPESICSDYIKPHHVIARIKEILA